MNDAILAQNAPETTWGQLGFKLTVLRTPSSWIFWGRCTKERRDRGKEGNKKVGKIGKKK